MLSDVSLGGKNLDIINSHYISFGSLLIVFPGTVKVNYSNL